MASNATDALLVDQLDALRLGTLSGPPDSTLVVGPPTPVPGQDTSPNSETTEPAVSSQQLQQQQDNGDCIGSVDAHYKNYTILCDMAYGMPREARPRKEKIRAIARQLVNFLRWQQQQSLLLEGVPLETNNDCSSVPSSPLLLQPAQVKIVGCADAAIEQSLKDRMLELWVQEEEEEQVQLAAATATDAGTSNNAEKPFIMNLPDNLTFTHQSLESFLAMTTTTEGNNSDPTTKKKEDAVVDWQHDKKVNARDDHGHGHEQAVIYLSPDASVALDPGQLSSPPSMVVVGLLIDRKHIQVDRSLKRAQALSIPAVRWPLEKIVLVQQEDDKSNSKSNSSTSSYSSATTTANTGILHLHASEPLNCDCILEGMQQWYWNYEKWYQKSQSCHEDDDSDDQKKAAAAREACFSDAVLQALSHHVERHPGRPIHKGRALLDD